MGLLAILFLATAVLYSSVGFGGGSTYLALLLIWGIPYSVFPIIALSCNIIVVSGNCFNYIRAGNLNIKLLLPFLIGSVPMAFVGGALEIEKDILDYNSKVAESKKLEEANFARMSGNLARQQARAAQFGYYAQAGTSLLKAFG